MSSWHYLANDQLLSVYQWAADVRWLAASCLATHFLLSSAFFCFLSESVTDERTEPHYYKIRWQLLIPTIFLKVLATKSSESLFNLSFYKEKYCQGRNPRVKQTKVRQQQDLAWRSVINVVKAFLSSTDWRDTSGRCMTRKRGTSVKSVTKHSSKWAVWTDTRSLFMRK